MNLIFPAIDLFRISRSIGYHHPARTITNGFMSLVYTSVHFQMRCVRRYPAGKDKELSAWCELLCSAALLCLLPPICWLVLLSDCTNPPLRYLAEHSLGSLNRCLPKLCLPGEDFTSLGHSDQWGNSPLPCVWYKAPLQNGKFLSISMVEVKL